VPNFTDMRDLQRRRKAQGIKAGGNQSPGALAVRFVVIPLLLIATTCYAVDDSPKVTRKIDGDRTTFPAKSIDDGVNALLGAIESCHSTDWAGKKPPELADLEKAQNRDHVRFVFRKPITVKVANERMEITEAIFADGAFLLRSGKKVMRATKYEFKKFQPFEEWYRQTLPVD
jgi:hypothetical protein